MPGIKELETTLFHAHISRCVSYAGVCVLVYDHFLTFSEEVRLIWSRPMNVVSILFLINRYTTPLILAVDIYDKGGLTEHLNTQFCKIWFVAEGYMNFLLLAVIHLLMVIRVNALYGKRKKIASVLYTAYALYFIATFSVLTPGMIQTLKTFYAENQFLHVCWGTIVGYFWLTWVPALALETLVFGLTAYKAWLYSQEQMNVPVARTLYRDGFQYYIVVMLCTLFPLLVWTEAPSTLHAMPKYAGMAIINVMGFRLVLNLRQHSLANARVSTFESYEMTPSPSPRTTEFPNKRHTKALGGDLPRFIGQCDSDWAVRNATASSLNLSPEKSRKGDVEFGFDAANRQFGAVGSKEWRRSGARAQLKLDLVAAAATSSQLEIDVISAQSASPSRLDVKNSELR
ncbi:unnamed protein product [Rhizoctonia solani]|uniref:DUF6533 domain-containing protein n=1 Tax=Rhizoctonia solani TaxID=456999 RepID=A0A8H3BZS0_9AGAM|nr:unnamed protein product [Rhizoctonia solani]